jgi:predicted nucleic acid-binding protein
VPLPFLDSNVLVYAYSLDERSIIAKQILLEGAYISVQVLNEFTNIARRKLGFGWPEITVSVSQIKSLCEPPLPLTVDIHEKARGLAERYKLTIYDACIIAVALAKGCETIFSEDMQHNMVIEDRIIICNPFR